MHGLLIRVVSSLVSPSVMGMMSAISGSASGSSSVSVARESAEGIGACLAAPLAFALPTFARPGSDVTAAVVAAGHNGASNVAYNWPTAAAGMETS